MKDLNATRKDDIHENHEIKLYVLINLGFIRNFYYYSICRERRVYVCLIRSIQVTE